MTRLVRTKYICIVQTTQTLPISLIYGSFTSFHRCYTTDVLFDEENPDVFNDYMGRIVIASVKIKTDYSIVGVDSKELTVHTIHTYTYIYAHIHTHTYTYINTHTHIHTCIYIYIYTYIQIHTYTYTYIHIHTYTYTYTYICIPSSRSYLGRRSIFASFFTCYKNDRRMHIIYACYRIDMYV
jgi:hypothetical protein